MADGRPRCITVIGWVWIVFGGLMCLVVPLALLDQSERSIQVFGVVFSILGTAQICVGVLALYSGISFLRLKSWSRGVLEVLSWLLLLYVVGFGAYFVYLVLGDFGIDSIVLLVVGAAGMGTWIFLLVIMIKCLRSKRVCEAMYGKPE